MILIQSSLFQDIVPSDEKGQTAVGGAVKGDYVFIVSEEAVNGLDLNEKYVQIRTMLTNEILRGSTGVAIRHQADVEGKEVENAKSF